MKILYLKLVNFKRMPLRDIEVFEHHFKSKLLIVTGPNGCGKAQPLNSFIKVPNGWDLMGNMKIGLEIIARDGTITKVNGVFPQGKKEVFKIVFADGRAARATGDHLWKVYLTNKNILTSKILTTLEIINIINQNKHSNTNQTLIQIDLPSSEQNENKNLPIDPYILGVILGSGCLYENIGIIHPNKFIMKKINEKLNDGLAKKVYKVNNKNNSLMYSIFYDIKGRISNIGDQLKDSGSMYENPYKKFIPKEYLYGSTEQRLELLQGLMDGSGYIDKLGAISFRSTSYKLTTQVQYLIRSLGGIANMSVYNHYCLNKKTQEKTIYQLKIKYKNPSKLFSLPKKKKKVNDGSKELHELKLSLRSIELDGFEETQCISIDHPDNLYITNDFIVTHNTSLFNELTPLPSDKNNFNKGGYKEIHIEKDKQIYRLISDFTDGAKFYFYLDDENLNASHNVTTQRELVFKYFGLTQTILDILIGVENFTDMSLLNRKKLFNSITHLNIDKIIDNYNQLKEEQKNNEFLLKVQISLSQAEEQKLINIDHLNNLLTSQKHTKEYLELLLDIRMRVHQHANDSDVDKAIQDFLNIQNKIKSLIDLYYTYITSYPVDNCNNYKAQLEIINYKLNDFYLILESKQKEINILNLNKQYNIKALKVELESLIYNRNKILNSLYMFKILDRPIEYFRNDILKLEVSLLEIIRTIPLNENKIFSKERYEKLFNRKQEALGELNKIITREAEINKDIQYLIQHKENIICPQCSYTWFPLDTDINMTKLKTEHKQLLELIIKLQTELVQIDKDLTELLEYFAIYKQYTILRNATYENLKPFWNHVDDGEFIFKEPSQINVLFKNATIEIESLAETDNIYKRIQELTKNIEILSTIKSTSIENLEADINEINDEISSIQTEKDKLINHIKNSEIVVGANTILNTARSHLERAITNVQDANLSFTSKDILNVVESELSKYKVILIEIEHEINNYNNIKYTIEKYKKIIDDIQSNIKVLNIILTELSPKNGLIAKSVSSFLNIIIENVNAIINTVWDYKMILKAINVEDEILNYKFKVEVEDKISIEDISKCSAGMRKIINFSFVRLIYKLYKFDNYPLFLDEFTTNLDNIHTQKFASLINQLSMNETYSQIFVISHINNDFYFSNKDIDLIKLND